MQKIPVIILPGIGQSRVQVVDENGQAVRDAWPLSVEAEQVLGPLKGPLMKMMLFRRDGGFSDAAARVISSLVDDLTSLPDGTSKYPLKAQRWEFPVSEYDEKQKNYLDRMVPCRFLIDAIGAENIFFFAYHSFGDAYAIADELDGYIQAVKARTGSEKVHLMPVSLGGVLALAYLDRYCEKGDVDRVISVAAVWGGTHLTADIMEANFDWSDPKQTLKALGKNTEETFSGIIDMLPGGVAETTLTKCAEALSEAIAVNSTMMWGTVPRDRYLLLRQKYLLDGKHDKILADADRLHRLHVENQEFADRLKQAGVEMFLLCGYGKRLFALCGSGDVLSDGIVDTASASLGAKCAPVGQTFAVENRPTLSPDGMVDAASCLYPDSTWFFAGQGHDAFAGNDVALRLCARIASDPAFSGVDSDPAFPRFNGSRDLRKLEKTELPRLKELAESELTDQQKTERQALLQAYDVLCRKTLLTGNGETDALQKRMASFLAGLSAGNPEA